MEAKEQNSNRIFKTQSSQNFLGEEKSILNISFSKKRPIYRSPRLSRPKDQKPQANTLTETNKVNKVNIDYKRQIPIPTIKPIENSSKTTIKSSHNTSSYQKYTVNTNSQNKNYLSTTNINVKSNQKGNMPTTKPVLTSSSSTSNTRRNQSSQRPSINSSKVVLQIKTPIQQNQKGNNKRTIPVPTIPKVNNISLNNNKISYSTNSYSRKESSIPQENKENLPQNNKGIIISQYTSGMNYAGKKPQVTTNKDYGRKDYTISTTKNVGPKTQRSQNHNIVVVNQTRTIGKK